MKIAIDSGNTFTKTGFFENGKLVKVLRLSNQEFTSAPPEISETSLIVASVSSVDFAFLKPGKNAIFLNSNTPVPVENAYETPETLGMDRLASVTGAKTLFPDKACLIITCGTCITYDYITENAVYQGGSISPGIKMRFNALNHFTARLPLVEFSEVQLMLTGKNTHDSILSGVLNGVLAETEGIIARYKQVSPGCTIIISGGDSDFFERNIKGDIFVVPDLVLLGLNSILEYNESL